MSKKPIFLWGYMGAGKTRLGKRLASKLSIEYFDLDHVIEQRMNLVISEIFNQFGEAYFRELEKEIVNEFSQKKSIILSCGGGTPCFHENKSTMTNNGLVIYLDVQQEELVQRLWRNRTLRPLIAKMESAEELDAYISKHLKERMPYYKHAHLSYGNTYPKGKLDTLLSFIKTEWE